MNRYCKAKGRIGRLALPKRWSDGRHIDMTVEVRPAWHLNRPNYMVMKGYDARMVPIMKDGVESLISCSLSPWVLGVGKSGSNSSKTRDLVKSCQLLDG